MPRASNEFVDYQSQAEKDKQLKIMERLAAREPEALEEFFRYFGPALFGFAKQSLGTIEDAEEVFQDMLMKIWDKAPQYSAEKSRPYTWALMILRGLCIDQHRRYQRRIVSIPLSADDLTRGAEFYPPGFASDVRAAFSALSPGDQELLSQALFGQLAHPALAAARSEPLGTLKSRIRRALQRLERWLDLTDDTETPTPDSHS